MSEGIPTSLGPASRTVIGGNTYPPSDSVAKTLAPPAAKPQWKKFLIPAGIAGAIFLAMRYKGHL